MKGTGRPVWEDTAPPDDVATLDPGIPEWIDRPDVLVVGGGVVGLFVAAFCSREGRSVLLIERDRLAGAASGRAAGGLSPEAHLELNDTWRALARSSLELHRELDAEWDYGLRTLDVLVPPDLCFANQAHVDPLRLAAALARRVGVVATGVGFLDWSIDGDRVTRVRTTNGDVAPGAVVVATGTAPVERGWTTESWVKGHLIATEPAPFELREFVADGEILVVQLADGRLVAGGTKDRDDDTETLDEAVVARIERRLVELVPEARRLERTHVWCCFRPCSSDELPIIDLVPGISNAWLATGLFTTGLLMAPIVGRSVARWIAGGRADEMSSFTLDRLQAV